MRGTDHTASKSQLPRVEASRERDFARARRDGPIAIVRRMDVSLAFAAALALAKCKGFVREIRGRTMRAGVVACVGFALALAGCNLTLEEKFIQEGIGTELSAVDIAESTRRLELYLSYLCVQAGGTTLAGEAPDTIASCDMSRYGNAQWTALVRAGFNDIDRRCDSYLAWLASRRRDRNAILSQIHDTRTFTEALLYTTGVGAAPIAIAGLAFGLASNSFTNYYSRLLFEIEKSTVSLLVREKRLHYRDTMNVRIAFQPDAVHVLREYMLICTPFYIEDLVNQRTRDSVSGNTPADKGNAEQIRRSLVAGALISSIPSGGPRGDLPGVAGQPGGPARPTTMGQPSTEVERQLPKAMGQMLQANLCAGASGSFDAATREAIRQAKVGANMSRVAKRAEPLFKPVNDELRNASELQIFLDARNCRNDSSGVDRGYVTAFEKFRFPDDVAIKSFQTSLAGCDPNVKPTGIFDGPTRTAISAATGRTGSPVSKTDRLTPKAYEWVNGVCL